MTPTTRTLAMLRDEGYHVAVVERFNIFARVRQDLFGCIDIVAIRHDVAGVLGVQTTTGSNASKRIKKAVAIPALAVWLEAGNRFEVHSWCKRGPRGKRKAWGCKRRAIGLNDPGIAAGRECGRNRPDVV